MTTDALVVVLVTHGSYGAAMVAAAEAIVGALGVAVIELSTEEVEPADIARRLGDAVGEHPALLLSDLCGSTPANVCLALAATRSRCEVITGVNLPMLVKLANCEALREAGRASALALELQRSSRRSIQRGVELSTVGARGRDER